MLQLILVIAAAFAVGYLYASERARDAARRRLGAAPEPVRRASETLAAAASAGAHRVEEAVGSAPIPDAVKQAASRAIGTGQSTAASVTRGESAIERPSAAEIAGRPKEPLPRIHP